MLPTPDPPSDAERDIALRRYDTVVKLLTTDSQIYWARSQVFLVANAALVGFEFSSIPIANDARQTKLLALAVGAATGIILCILWRRGLKAGKAWTEHWKAALRTWEQAAFGDVNLYRVRPPHISRAGIVARGTAMLFLALWIIVAAYVALCLYLRWAHRPLP
jgi:hypothetical protein